MQSDDEVNETPQIEAESAPETPQDTTAAAEDGPAPDYLTAPDGARIAIKGRAGKGPCVLWCGGFKSDMEGTKALALDAWAEKKGRAFRRFDYFGHGASDGDFEAGTISRWRDDALLVLDEAVEGPAVLVGSSMGAWIATLVALARPDRIKACVFIAPAPDFTEALFWENLSPEDRAKLMAEGHYDAPSEYDDEPYRYTKKLVEDGRENLVLGGAIDIRKPVRILQGMKDDAVPHAHALRFAEALMSDDVVIALDKKGDHRLSDEVNLRRLVAAVEELSRGL